MSAFQNMITKASRKVGKNITGSRGSSISRLGNARLDPAPPALLFITRRPQGARSRAGRQAVRSLQSIVTWAEYRDSAQLPPDRRQFRDVEVGRLPQGLQEPPALPR